MSNTDFSSMFMQGLIAQSAAWMQQQQELAREQAANVAAAQEGSMKYAVDGTTIAANGTVYHNGDKCNEFVCDVTQKSTGHRAQIPYTDIRGWLFGETRDPSAKEWATVPILGWSAPLPLSSASPAT
jgi:hypothetical protein